MGEAEELSIGERCSIDRRARWIRTRLAVRVAAVATAFGLAAGLLAGCGSGDDGVAPGGVTERDAPVRIDDEPLSPLESVVGFSSDTSRRNQQFLIMQRRANETVVSCMAAAGFEYWVEPVSPSFLLGPRSGDGSRAWVEVTGLGIATSLIELSRPAPSAVVIDADATNRAYTGTLDPDRAAAYDLALIGDRGADGTGQFQPDGCWSRAYGQVVVRLAVLAEFTNELEALSRRIDADPRVGGLMETWSACMAERGHLYAARGALIDDLFARLLSVDYVQGSEGLEFTDPQAVEELLGLEIEVGLDDWDCRQHVDGELVELRHTYEREFLGDNGRRIEAMLAAAES